MVAISLLFTIPYKSSYQRVETSQIVPVEAQIKPKTTISAPKKVKVAHYLIPTPKALELISYVSRETGYSVELLSKIAKAESHYDLSATHLNKNGSIDYSLWQINSQHIPLATSMGLDIKDPKDNSDFAIYLMKKNGLSDWCYSKKNWI